MKTQQIKLLNTIYLTIWSLASFAQIPATIYGEYNAFGKGTSSTLSKTVTITKSQDFLTKVTIQLSFPQGQSCELEGNANWKANQLTIIADGLETNKPCKLILKIKNNILTLHDIEGKCKEVYCGAGTGFELLKFKKKK